MTRKSLPVVASLAMIVAVGCGGEPFAAATDNTQDAGGGDAKPAARLDISPKIANFSPIQGVMSQVFVISNGTDQTLSGGVATAIDPTEGATSFVIEDGSKAPCDQSLAPGKSCELSVRFKPPIGSSQMKFDAVLRATAPGDLTATAELHGNAGAPAPDACLVLEKPSPPVVVDGMTAPDEETVGLVLRNDCTYPLNKFSFPAQSGPVTVSGKDVSCNGVLAGASCNVDAVVHVQPGTVPKTYMVSFLVSAEHDQSLEIPFQVGVDGKPDPSGLALYPTAKQIDFGAWKPGTSPGPVMRFTVVNSDPIESAPLSWDLTADADTRFRELTFSTCEKNAVLKGGQKCSIQVQYAPAPPWGGGTKELRDEATLIVGTSDGQLKHETRLLATTRVGPVLKPDSLFRYFDSPGAVKLFELTNDSAVKLVVASPVMPNGFAVDKTTCGPLAAGGTCELAVRYVGGSDPWTEGFVTVKSTTAAGSASIPALKLWVGGVLPP